MKATLLLFVLALPFVACNSTVVVRNGEPSRLGDLNKQAARQTAEVTLVDGRQVRARSLRMASDSTSWIDPRSGSVVSTATPDVVRVQFTSHAQGALEGAGVGFAAGALVLGLGMAATWEPCRSTGFMSCFMHPESPEQAALWGGAAGGVLGLPLGIIGGAVKGSRRTYEIEFPPAVPLVADAKRK